MSKYTKSGAIYIVTAAALWALDGIIRRSLFTLSPLVIVFYEHLIGSIILTPFIFTQFGKEKFDGASYGWAALVALLSGLLGTLWFTTALVKVNFISFSVVFLLQKLQPIFATTSASLLLKEKVTRNYALWAAAAMGAAYFVTFPGGRVNFATGSQTIIAALYAVGAAFAWGSSTSFSKKLLAKHPHDVTTGLRFYVTTILAFVAILIFQNNALVNLDATQIARFSFIAISTGMVALLIYYRGLQQTEAKIATILELIFPVLAVFIDAVLYKTLLAPSQYIAALMLIFTVYQTSRYASIAK